MSVYHTIPLSFDRIRTYPLARRKSKVTVREFAKPVTRGAGVRALLDSLPLILAADDLRAVVAAIARARTRRKIVLAPLPICLLRRGCISGIAMNGAALLHDFEIALVGNTSEDVEASLGGGQFGMAEETGLYLNEMAVGAARSAARGARDLAMGLGEAAGKLLTSGRLRAKYPQASVLVAAYQARVP